jgi:molybdopterin-biosynthesis enzyme MoeA-like protein
VPVVRHPKAERVLSAYYGETLNPARLRMADMPRGATPIPNPVSAAPGFRLENVHVMAGVPRIMQAMFDGIAHTLVPAARRFGPARSPPMRGKATSPRP